MQSSAVVHQNMHQCRLHISLCGLGYVMIPCNCCCRVCKRRDGRLISSTSGGALKAQLFCSRAISRLPRLAPCVHQTQAFKTAPIGWKHVGRLRRSAAAQPEATQEGSGRAVGLTGARHASHPQAVTPEEKQGLFEHRGLGEELQVEGPNVGAARR